MSNLKAKLWGLKYRAKGEVTRPTEEGIKSALASAKALLAEVEQLTPKDQEPYLQNIHWVIHLLGLASQVLQGRETFADVS